MDKDANEVLTSSAIKEKFAKFSADPGTMSQPEFAKFVNAEIDKWADVAKRAKLQPK
ncbi:MAG: hypothetical protein K2Y16_14110 [Burkholderiales bacterium]|nr:hypothetical protein [Burkholderiales bacterium]